MNYGKAIKTIRSARGFTQRQLAKKLEIDPSYISRIEAGERAPATETLEALAKSLNIPLFLLVLLASEKEDIQRAPVDLVDKLGRSLLDIIISEA